jgi:hypothetical protein
MPLALPLRLCALEKIGSQFQRMAWFKPIVLNKNPTESLI